MSEIRKLIADLGKVPAELRQELRPAIQAAAQEVLQEARSRSSWSSRIPGATRIAIRFTGKAAGASVVVSAARAPHGRPYEHLGSAGTFRHPVYGGRGGWVSQQAKPFLFPAAKAKREAVAREIDKAVEQALRRTGWR